MGTVIKVENISKQYRLGDVGTGTLSHDLKRWWYKVRGKEDPYLLVSEINDRSKKGESDYVWALKDINFEVKAGEVLGIIGRNGAGKSTLLKILSKTTTPTKGSIKVKGRIASLLEVGTGFHPELTGRENIFLNGAILGMTKREIQLKFDEIVDFSGVERYIDTPVKRYSSGMYVRLAFAVAAHLEPEILIVDEVLAVGDVDFQKKCLGKMKDVSVNEGRTVLFVSHNLDAIRELTDQSLLLVNGEVNEFGFTNTVIDAYLNRFNDRFGVLSYSEENWEVVKMPHLLGEVSIQKAVLLNNDTVIESGSELMFLITFKGNIKMDYSGLSVGLRVMSQSDQPIGTWFSKPNIKILQDKFVEYKFRLSKLLLAPGKYYFTVWIGVGDYKAYGKDFYSVDKIFWIEIIPPKSNDGTLPVWYPTFWGNVIFDDLEIQGSKEIM